MKIDKYKQSYKTYLKNYDKYESERQEYITGLEGYDLTKKVSYNL